MLNRPNQCLYPNILTRTGVRKPDQPEPISPQRKTLPIPIQFSIFLHTILTLFYDSKCLDHLMCISTNLSLEDQSHHLKTGGLNSSGDKALKEFAPQQLITPDVRTKDHISTPFNCPNQSFRMDGWLLFFHVQITLSK